MDKKSDQPFDFFILFRKYKIYSAMVTEWSETLQVTISPLQTHIQIQQGIT